MCAYSTIDFIVDFDCYCALRGFIRTDYKQLTQPAPFVGAGFCFPLSRDLLFETACGIMDQNI